MAGKKYRIPKQTTRVSENTLEMEPSLEEAVEFRFRRLRRGETAEYDFFGLSYARLDGDGIRILVFPNGSDAPTIPGAAVSARMNDFAIAALILREIGTFRGEEVSFIRRVLELTQQQFAERCGLSRETINAFENGREPVTATVTSMIQRRFLPEALAALGRIADAFRNLDIRKFARLQAELDKKWAEGFTAARGVKLLLSHRPR